MIMENDLTQGIILSAISFLILIITWITIRIIDIYDQLNRKNRSILEEVSKALNRQAKLIYLTSLLAKAGYDNGALDSAEVERLLKELDESDEVNKTKNDAKTKS